MTRPVSNEELAAGLRQRCSAVAGFVLTGLLLLTAALHGTLLAGLIAACLGFALTRAMSRRRLGGHSIPASLAAAVCLITPVAALVVLGFQARGLTAGAVGQFPALMEQLARTVLELREKMPESLAQYVPAGMAAVQEWLAGYLKSQARVVASLGQSMLGGTLLAYVGLVVGSLAAAASGQAATKPLSAALCKRAANFLGAFYQVVAAQFWIAAFNATCTAIFLYAVLPAFEVSLPYSRALVLFTFLAGLVPIVGNLLCNGVLALVGTSVSPLVGLACLGFLIGIHKFEYFINAKVVGTRTKTRAWELLAAMFIGESLVGIPGLVAAPLYYAYLKKELRDADLV